MPVLVAKPLVGGAALPSKPLAATSDSPAVQHAENPKPAQTLAIPAVHLDAETITSAMAARLATSLVSHVLFLKNQIPFPVVQLSRMPGLNADSKAGKKKLDLVNAIDTLSSHLHTTFRALSTAFAIARAKQDEQDSSSPAVHMAIIIGPSVGAPKARVMLVMNGLEVKHAGAASSSKTAAAPSSADSDEEQEDEEDELSEEEGDPVPDSDSEDESEDEEENSEEEEESDDDPATPLRSDSTSNGPSFNTTEPAATFLEEQQAMRTADRLLSRTLASACAESDGGLSSELALTQTHIVLRAPRHFSHPEWTPRQNFTRALEKTLNGFLQDAVASAEASKPAKKSYVAGSKTEGVWIGSENQELSTELTQPENADLEENDMIWWTWNGKIVGFNDW